MQQLPVKVNKKYIGSYVYIKYDYTNRISKKIYKIEATYGSKYELSCYMVIPPSSCYLVPEEIINKAKEQNLIKHILELQLRQPFFTKIMKKKKRGATAWHKTAKEYKRLKHVLQLPT